jgi:hypothetical protein
MDAMTVFPVTEQRYGYGKTDTGRDQYGDISANRGGNAKRELSSSGKNSETEAFFFG